MTGISLVQLPIDILLNILKKLQLTDLFNVIITCKTLRELILYENSIWRHVLSNRLIINDSTTREDKVKWPSICRISNNWCKGIFKSQVAVQHRINYMPWLSFHNSQALLLSVGSSLHCYATTKKRLPNGKEMLWKLNVPIIQRNDIRTNDISRFIVRNELLVCGNRDGGVAVYKWDDLKQKPKLVYHIEDCHENGRVEVSTVELVENYKSSLITGSNDCQYIKFWHWQTQDCHSALEYKAQNFMDVLITDGWGVRCMAVNESMDKLAIGLNGNRKPVLLDTNIGKLLMTAEATKDVKQVTRDICWHDENTVEYVTHSGVLQLVDIRSHETIYTVKDPFHSTLYCVKSDGRNAIVVGSSEYSRCVLFDVRNSSKHVQMYFTNHRSSPVYSLDFDSAKLIAAVDRGVSVLNFNVSSAIPKKDYSDAFQA